MAVITDKGEVMTMGSEDHGKLGHTVQVKTDAEILAEKKQKLKYGHHPNTGQLKAAVDFVKGELEGKNVVQVSCGF